MRCVFVCASKDGQDDGRNQSHIFHRYQSHMIVNVTGSRQMAFAVCPMGSSRGTQNSSKSVLGPYSLYLLQDHIRKWIHSYLDQGAKEHKSTTGYDIITTVFFGFFVLFTETLNTLYLQSKRNCILDTIICGQKIKMSICRL